MDAERRTLRAWSAEVVVADHGTPTAATGETPPVVLLHGEEGPAAAAGLVEGLRGTHRVIAVTHPGFDRRARIPGVDRPRHLAYLYLDLLDELGLQRCALVGTSLGAWVALEMAVMQPRRFATVTAIGPLGIKVNGPAERSFAEIVVEAPDRIREILYTDPAQDPWRDRSEPDDVVERAEFRESFMHYGWEPYLHDPSLPALLARVSCPVLVVTGDEDRLTPPGYAEALLARVRDGRWERVAGAGHYPEIERPEETVELIRKFSVLDADGDAVPGEEVHP